MVLVSWLCTVLTVLLAVLAWLSLLVRLTVLVRLLRSPVAHLLVFRLHVRWVVLTVRARFARLALCLVARAVRYPRFRTLLEVAFLCMIPLLPRAGLFYATLRPDLLDRLTPPMGGLPPLPSASACLQDVRYMLLPRANGALLSSAAVAFAA